MSARSGALRAILTVALAGAAAGACAGAPPGEPWAPPFAAPSSVVSATVPPPETPPCAPAPASTTTTATTATTTTTRAPAESSPPLVTSLGAHALTVVFTPPGPAVGATDVETIELDGRPLFPPTCDTRRDGLCSPAHRQLRNVDGRGAHLVLLRREDPEGASRARLFFAAITRGSPECGAYGFWALRLDAAGVRVSEPVAGCFQTPHTEWDEDDEPSPLFAWGDPSVLWAWSEGRGAVQVHVLHEPSFRFERVVHAKTGGSGAAASPFPAR